MLKGSVGTCAPGEQALGEHSVLVAQQVVAHPNVPLGCRCRPSPWLLPPPPPPVFSFARRWDLHGEWRAVVHKGEHGSKK